MKVVDYILVSETTNHELKAKVLYWLNSGWQLYYAPFTSGALNNGLNQVMVKCENNLPTKQPHEENNK